MVDFDNTSNEMSSTNWGLSNRLLLEEKLSAKQTDEVQVAIATVNYNNKTAFPPHPSPYGDTFITRLPAQTALIRHPPDARAPQGEGKEPDKFKFITLKKVGKPTLINY